MYLLKRDGKFHFIESESYNDKYITPLITDTHLHVLGLGTKLLNPNLEGKTNIEIREIIEEKLKSNPSKIILRGWSEPDALPDKNFLDSISTDIPIFLTRRCGHIAYVNSYILNNTDFKDTKMYVDYHTGRITEKALEVFYESSERRKDYTREFHTSSEYLFDKGYGYVHSDDIHGLTKSELPFDEKHIKVFEKVAVNNYEELLKYDREGYFEEFKAVKVYMDGSFGGRTAYLRENYDDEPVRGELVWNAEELYKVMSFCESKKIHLCMHAIGDGAIDTILETAEKINPKTRHRIIHAAMLHDEQIELIIKHNIILDMQPSFVTSDEKMLPPRIGNRMKTAYRFDEVYRKNIELFLSSDAPIETPDWFYDANLLNKRYNLPLGYIIYRMTYGPESIDGFDREKDMEKQYLVFDKNPFEELTKPKVVR